MHKSEKNNAANIAQKEEVKTQPRVFSRFKMPEERLREAEAEKAAAAEARKAAVAAAKEAAKPKEDTLEEILRFIRMRREKNRNNKVTPQANNSDVIQSQTRSKPTSVSFSQQEIVALDIQPIPIQERPKATKPAEIITEEINENSVVAPLPTRTEIISRQFSRKKIPTQKIIPAHSAVEFNKGLKLGSALDDDDFDSPRNPQSLDLDSNNNYFEQDPDYLRKMPAQAALGSNNMRHTENMRPNSSTRPKSNQSKKVSEKEDSKGWGFLGFFGLK